MKYDFQKMSESTYLINKEEDKKVINELINKGTENNSKYNINKLLSILCIPAAILLDVLIPTGLLLFTFPINPIFGMITLSIVGAYLYVDVPQWKDRIDYYKNNMNNVNNDNKAIYNKLIELQTSNNRVELKVERYVAPSTSNLITPEESKTLPTKHKSMVLVRK
ncbi:MAG: hypothetical protein K6C11_01630 [Bacilli bacterium]|nr:hypothetical protein [Bacilli bacterium]